MRAWTRGERIGFWSMVIGALTCAAVLSTVPPFRSWFHGPSEDERLAEASRAADYQAAFDEQRKLLAEQSLAVRDELRRLYEERVESRRVRIDGIAQGLTKGEDHEYDTLVLVNQCAFPIDVAIYYRDLDDKWITRGWWSVAAGASVTTNAYTRNAFVYFYAENANVGRVWDGTGKAQAINLSVVNNRFDYLEGDRFVWDDPRTVSFYRRHTGDKWTNYDEIFECPVEALPGQ